MRGSVSGGVYADADEATAKTERHVSVIAVTSRDLMLGR
jgi:hypothetical protein